jgi:hypothetical protein
MITTNTQSPADTKRPSRRSRGLLAATLGLIAAAGLAFVSHRSAAADRHLFMDVHHLGPGSVTLADVVAAHQKDLAVEGELGVDYQRYWVDEDAGAVYCLVDAPSAEAAAEVHRRAHGLVADELVEVQAGILPAPPTGDRELFLDTHRLGPGAITGEDVAAAHRKDLEVQDEYDVRFLEYWYDETTGTVQCLAEGPSREAIIDAHQAAHGLIPDEIHPVQAGE